MAQERRTSPARVKLPERQQLLSPLALGGLVTLVVGALVLVFPGQSLLDTIYRHRESDNVALSYLVSLLKTDPGNTRLRLTLVERQIANGDLEAARIALAPLRATDGSMPAPVRLLEYRLWKMESEKANYGNGTDRRLHNALSELAQLDWHIADLVFLAEEAQFLRRPDLAARFYEKIANVDERGSEPWIERAVQSALGGGDYTSAAAIYLKRIRLVDPARQRTYFINGIKVLQSGNQLQAALVAADTYIDELVVNDEILIYLVQLARAANDPLRAQAYARKLMRMSKVQTPLGLWTLLSGWMFTEAHAAEAPRSGPPSGIRPFDDEKYTLAYDVFVGNGSLVDAYRVAEAAVLQVPGNLAWRLRLAQVAEWSGHPDKSLEQWRYIVRNASENTQRELAWQSVLRLAPGLQDDDALLAAWLHQADTRKLNAQQWHLIADAYERLARAEEGAAYFSRRYAQSPEEIFLEIEAYLLERLGRDERAIAAYRRLVTAHPATGKRLISLALLLLRNNRYQDAFAILDKHRRQVEPADAEFWNLFADLAWQLQQDRAASEAYGVLAGQPKPDDTTFIRLVELTRVSDRENAARVAETGYVRSRSPRLLLLAAEIRWQQGDLAALKKLYGSLTPEDEKRMTGNAYFFALRAQYRNAAGQPGEALADYRRALAIAPGATDNVAALMWHLVGQRNLDELRREVRVRQGQARVDRGLWEVFAAAYVALDDVPRALAFYRRLSDTRSGDYLWLINYADVLERGGSAAMALRVRRHAWTVLRTSAGKDSKALQREQLEALARLTLLGAPGDDSLYLVRRILRQDFSGPAATGSGDSRLDAGMRELILSWALSTEQSDSAKAWLWSRYARQLTKPSWAELAVALNDNDRQAIDRILDTDTGDLPVDSRIEAASAVGRVKLAQSLAFDAQTARPDDDALHLRMSDNMLATANAVAYEFKNSEAGVLKGTEQRANVALWISSRLRLTLDYGHYSNLQSTSSTSLVNVPGNVDEMSATLRLRHDGAYTDFRLLSRTAAADHTGIGLAHGRELSSRLSALLGVSYRDKATETVPLFLGGTRDRANASLNYRLGPHEYAYTEAWAARFHTQDGSYLGRGEGIGWEVGHRFRIEYPDWRVRMTGAHSHFLADGQVDARAARLDPTGGAQGAAFFIPQSFDVYGVYASFGDSFRDRYSRAFRPWLDIGPTWNSVSGNGFLFSIGAGSSLFGHDRLSAYFTRSKGGNAIGGYTTIGGVGYEILFDR